MERRRAQETTGIHSHEPKQVSKWFVLRGNPSNGPLIHSVRQNSGQMRMEDKEDV